MGFILVPVREFRRRRRRRHGSHYFVHPQPGGVPPAAPVPSRGGAPQVRIIPLGGFEEVGRNCLLLEVGEDRYLIDLGLQFPEEDMLGIDYLVPDVSYLRGKERTIRAVLFTHGHLDHIGAVQHVLPTLGFPPCYGTKLTIGFIRRRLAEAQLTSRASLHVAEYGRRYRLGSCEVEFLRVTHSIPDSAAIAVHTPRGTIVHSGDFKFDLTPVNEPPADFARLCALGDRGVLAFLCESTNALKPGHVMSERAIGETIDGLIREAQGRVILSTFSSLLNRIQQVIDSARLAGRKVYVSGRSMEQNVEIATQLGYLHAPRGLVRTVGPGIERLPDREVLILTTGAQGEEMASLSRIGLGTHRHVAVRPGDTVILSSNPIIGNERAVATVINNLHLKGARVLTSATLDLHTTGHAYQKDLLLMHRLIRARHVIPCHGEPYMRAAHADLLRTIGYQENQLHLLTNGEVLEIDAASQVRRSKQKVSASDVIIDGRGASSEGERVLEDRKQLSSSGVLIVVLRAYSTSKRLVGSPDVISRGLFYGSERQEITAEVASTAQKAYEETLTHGDRERAALKQRVTEAIHRYFRRKLNREPTIVPIVVEV